MKMSKSAKNAHKNKQSETVVSPEFKKLEYKAGLHDGIPTALAYVTVGLTFGLFVTSNLHPVWSAVLISMSNTTSAGQFAGFGIILASGAFLEMALAQLIINLRYGLMGISLSQKLDDNVSFWDRLIIAFVNTDEVFAMAMSKPNMLSKYYMFGLITLPYVAWSGGTLIGAVLTDLLPMTVIAALGIAIYGMFVGLVVPPAKKDKVVLRVVILAILLSSAITYLPIFSFISSGFNVIITTLIASAYGAAISPIKGGGVR